MSTNKNTCEPYKHVIPNFFAKKEVPRHLPVAMQRAVKELQKTASQRACLEKAFSIVTKRFHGGRGVTYTRFLDLYRNDMHGLWKRPGFLHCTNSNFLLRVLLVRSGKFTDADIKLAYTHIMFSPHQYLKVRVGAEWIAADPWAAFTGVPLGEYAHGFR